MIMCTLAERANSDTKENCQLQNDKTELKTTLILFEIFPITLSLLVIPLHLSEFLLFTLLRHMRARTTRGRSCIWAHGRTCPSGPRFHLGHKRGSPVLRRKKVTSSVFHAQFEKN